MGVAMIRHARPPTIGWAIITESGASRLSDGPAVTRL
jgi:hypothetical protein